MQRAKGVQASVLMCTARQFGIHGLGLRISIHNSRPGISTSQKSVKPLIVQVCISLTPRLLNLELLSFNKQGQLAGFARAQLYRHSVLVVLDASGGSEGMKESGLMMKVQGIVVEV